MAAGNKPLKSNEIFRRWRFNDYDNFYLPPPRPCAIRNGDIDCCRCGDGDGEVFRLLPLGVIPRNCNKRLACLLEFG